MCFRHELNLKTCENNLLLVRQTQLAYVDVAAKPPRGVRRAQIRNGTAGSMNKQVSEFLPVP